MCTHGQFSFSNLRNFFFSGFFFTAHRKLAVRRDSKELRGLHADLPEESTVLTFCTLRCFVKVRQMKVLKCPRAKRRIFLLPFMKIRQKEVESCKEKKHSSEVYLKNLLNYSNKVFVHCLFPPLGSAEELFVSSEPPDREDMKRLVSPALPCGRHTEPPSSYAAANRRVWCFGYFQGVTAAASEVPDSCLTGAGRAPEGTAKSGGDYYLFFLAQVRQEMRVSSRRRKTKETGGDN